jgi:hypothetical protein
VDPNAQPGQPGYLDPNTGLVTPYSSNNVGATSTSTAYPTTDSETAFNVIRPLDGIKIQALSGTQAFNADEMEFKDGIWAACIESDNNGSIICATYAGDKYAEDDAEEAIIAKLRAADTGTSARANPGASVQDTNQTAMSIAMRVKPGLETISSDIQGGASQYTSSCDVITAADAKAACRTNAQKLNRVAAGVRDALNNVLGVGLGQGGGAAARKRRSKSKRGSAKRRAHRR